MVTKRMYAAPQALNHDERRRFYASKPHRPPPIIQTDTMNVDTNHRHKTHLFHDVGCVWLCV